MKAYTIYLGLTTQAGVDRSDEPESRIIREVNHTLKGFRVPGATILRGTGVWRGQVEACLVIYLCTEEHLDIEDLCGALAHDFEQREVAYHESPTLAFVANPTT